MNRQTTTRKLNVKTNKKDDIIEFKHNIIQSQVLSALIHYPQQIHHSLHVIRDWVVGSVPSVVTLNIKTKSCKYKKTKSCKYKELNHEQMLLVFVNLLNNNNFSVKYIHLKNLFFGK